MTTTPNLDDLLGLEEARVSGNTEPVPSGMISRTKRVLCAKIELRRLRSDLARMREALAELIERAQAHVDCSYAHRVLADTPAPRTEGQDAAT